MEIIIKIINIIADSTTEKKINNRKQKVGRLCQQCQWSH